MEGLILLLIMFGVLWLILIRPQQRRVRQHHALLSELVVGDEVVTAGGMIGRITALEDDRIRVEVAPGVELRMLRAAVNRRLGPEPPATAPDDELPGDVT